MDLTTKFSPSIPAWHDQRRIAIAIDERLKDRQSQKLLDKHPRSSHSGLVQ